MAIITKILTIWPLERAGAPHLPSVPYRLTQAEQRRQASPGNRSHFQLPDTPLPSALPEAAQTPHVQGQTHHPAPKPGLSSFLFWSPRFRCSFSLLATPYLLPRPDVLCIFLQKRPHFPHLLPNPTAPTLIQTTMTSPGNPFHTDPPGLSVTRPPPPQPIFPLSNYFPRKLADSKLPTIWS